MSREYSSAVRPLPASSWIPAAWLAVVFGAVLLAAAALPPGWFRVVAVAATGIIACFDIGRIGRLQRVCERVRLDLAGAAISAGGRVTPVQFDACSLVAPGFSWLAARADDGRTWSLVVLPWGQRDAYRRFYVVWRWGYDAGPR